MDKGLTNISPNKYKKDVAVVATSKYKLRSISQKMNDTTTKMMRNLKKENVKLKHDIASQKEINKKVVPSVLTQNRYASLAQDNQMNWNDENGHHPNTNSKKNKVSKPPPIKVTDDRLKTTDIKKFLNDLQISSFQAKSISIGIKIDLDTKEDYEKCIANLTAEKIAFFTHRDKDQKTFKVVLSGLPRIETEVIVDEMKLYNITPSSVTELTKNPHPNHCLYLVQFSNKDVSLSQLRKVRAIDHIIVKWNPFKPHNKGPTQCTKCAMFGHGAKNCHRSEACLLCASSTHIAANCNFNENTKEAFVFKCYNCISKKLPNINHRANDPKCPCRSNYLEIRNNINHKNTIRNDRAKSFNINQERFPDLNKTSSPNISTATQRNGPTYAEQTKQLRGNNDLYSMDDLFEIFQTAVEDLSACTSKGQQLKVLFKLLSNAYE